MLQFLGNLNLSETKTTRKSCVSGRSNLIYCLNYFNFFFTATSWKASITSFS